MKKIYLIIILSLTMISVCFFLLKFNSSRNTIDYLNQSLTSVKKTLTNHSTISMIATDNNYTELYYQTQFILVPNIIEGEDVDNDTILVIERQKRQKTNFSLDNYNVILTDSNSMFYIILCSKKH